MAWIINHVNLLCERLVVTYRTNLKFVCTAQKRFVRALFATAQQRRSRDIFSNQKNLSIYTLINQQE